jgi:hypothetical protein
MDRPRPRPTPDLEQVVAAYIRAGGFPHVAAEAAGLPRAVFEDWLRRGQAPRPAAALRRFCDAVRLAQAQARLGAEIAALKDKPLDWLKAGPGKERPDAPGWSALAKAQAGRGKPTPLLLQPEMQAFLRALLRALEAHPEARAAAAEQLARLKPVSS